MNSYVSHHTAANHRATGYVTSSSDKSDVIGYVNTVSSPDHAGTYVDTAVVTRSR